MTRLLRRDLQRADRLQTKDLNALKDLPHTSTGWSGREPPIRVREDVIKAWERGELDRILKGFMLVGYSK